MKTLHGKRHIRARKSVVIGRQKRQAQRFNRGFRAFNDVVVACGKVDWVAVFGKVVEAVNDLTRQFYQGVTDNGDGTYTHAWNFEQKE